MLLDDYLNEVHKLLDKITVFTIKHSCTFDRRNQDQAHIFGVLIFINESSLHFREFIDTSEGTINKVAYSYHFQDKYNNLLFRYDNAKHKPTLAFDEHKHCSEGIIYAPNIDLNTVIKEVLSWIAVS